MTFDEYQKDAHKTAQFPQIIPSYIYLLLGLAGESGEVVEKFKKLLRNNEGVMPEGFKDDIKKELGDVLWYLAGLATSLELSFDDVAKANIEKLQSRLARNVIKSQGDDR